MAQQALPEQRDRVAELPGQQDQLVLTELTVLTGLQAQLASME